MTDKEFRGVLDLMRRCYLSPGEGGTWDSAVDLLNRESRIRGYEDWYVAYCLLEA